MRIADIKFQIRQVIKQAVQSIVLPVCYVTGRFRKIDPMLVVFADAHHNTRPASMEVLYRKLKKDGTWKITETYLDYGTAGAAAVARHSIGFMKLYAQAGCVVICDNFLPAASCRKRKGTKVIQLWHACGCYKKFGYDAKDDIPENYHAGNVYRNTDLVTVSGEAAVKAFASAMRLSRECVRPLGVSRTDLYFSRTWRQRCIERFYKEYPDAAGRKVVLWAPTFRGNAGSPEAVRMDLDGLQRQLGREYYVLARLHPHMMHSADIQATDSEGDHNYYCSIPTEELYPVIDILIADYSSLIYEYLLTGSGLVLYVPDLEAYSSRRGFYMDIREIPGEIVTDEADLAKAVIRAAQDTAQDKKSRTGITQKREQFLQTYMGMCDGMATERIVSWMKENVK